MRVCMRTIDILSPVALGPSEAKPLAPRLPTLRGKVLGIRIDRAWRSFHVYADELGRLARERLGVADVVVFDPETRIGTPEAESGKVVEFARRVDAAVLDLVETQGWGDGFPVIPPTEERVQAMLEATPLPPLARGRRRRAAPGRGDGREDRRERRPGRLQAGVLPRRAGRRRGRVRAAL